MSMTIKLDASAVRELFPEGSEARVEVIKAVAIDFVRRCAAKEFGGPIFNQLRQIAINEAYNAATESAEGLGVKLVSAGIGDKRVVGISDEMKKHIRVAVEGAISSVIHDVTKEHSEEAIRQANEKVSKALERVSEVAAITAKKAIVEKLNKALAN